MFKEFKEFAMKGNVLDMAIGVIMGGAFGKIVSSLVEDVIMPIFGLIFGKIDFANLYIALDGQKYETLKLAEEAKAPLLKYGLFINNIVQFIIIAFSIFLMVKGINKLSKKTEEVKEVTDKECPFCYSTINIHATRCPSCTSELD